jgi:Fe-S-cluster containining protein
MSSCTGKCCEDFCVGTSRFKDLEDLATQSPLSEIPDIVEMLIVIDHREDHDRYTCRHWNPQTHLCMIYDTRPDMCRQYPYEGTCEHCQLKLNQL